MQRSKSIRVRAFTTGWAVVLLAAIGASPISLLAAPSANKDHFWSKLKNLAVRGDFDDADKLVKRSPYRDEIITQVQTWLTAYEDMQAQRREMNLADFELYTKYAKQRIERKEYALALGQVLAASNVAADEDALLKAPWVTDLVRKSLAEAEKYRDEHEWRDAVDIYWRLAELYPHEPRYQKLERQMLSLLRLDLMFESGNEWEEHLEKVRWYDARKALQYIDQYYVKPVDFRELAEDALEHILLLSESQTAKERFAGLHDDAIRASFRRRVQAKLDEVRRARSYSLSDTTKLFRRVVNDINPATIQIPDELLISELMRGALEPLDDYTTVIWPSEAEEFDKHTRGDFIGVGISIIKNATEEIEVASPIEDTPAYRAGIQQGDIILKVDGQSLKGYSLTKTVSTITGPAGSDVTLAIRRDGKLMDVKLTRKKIKIPSVKGVDRRADTTWDHWLDQDLGIGYVRVTNFQANTVEDLSNAITELKADGLKGLVLDLRGNPGGLLTSAYNMASLFLDRGAGVVSTKGRIRYDDQDLRTRRDGQFTDLPLTVLVDEHSASASEIVSGALRDNHRGLVIGDRTFGKFSVQNLIPLGRSNAKLKITTAKYFLPSGDCLHRDPLSETWGVKPDILVPLVNKEQWQVYTMRREADRIERTDKADGGDDDSEEVVKSDDAEGAGAADGASNESADAKKAENGDATVAEAANADDQTDKQDKRIYERFRVRGVDRSRLSVAAEDNDKQSQAGSADAHGAKQEAGDSLADAKQEAETPVLKVGDSPAVVRAVSKDGKELKVVDLRFDGPRLEVYAENDKGKKAAVASLSINGHGALIDRLPPLEQPDDNERPEIDPQMETALLVMRLELTADRSPALAIAKAEDTTDAQPTAEP